MAQLFGTTKKGEKSWIYRMKNQKGWKSWSAITELLS